MLWATNAAPPDWPRAAGLAVDDAGFIAINQLLQSTSHDFVYAAGDVAAMSGTPRPKSGVYAVRQGPPLAQIFVMPCWASPQSVTGRSARFSA